jgi:DNA-binding NarL/FixJ family response regulator
VPSQEENHKIRIVVADLEGIFRMGLKRVLEADADLEVVAELDHPDQLVSEAGRLQPDVMFVQNEMLMCEVGALPLIRAASPATNFMVTASTLAEEDAVTLVEEGARGAILKMADPALFVKCAHKIVEGEIWLPKKQVAEIARRLSEHGTRPADTLTAREKLVISCLVKEGWRNRDIAEHLSISEQTVKNHLRSIYDKVGVSDRVELVLYAIHQHLDLPSVAGKDE